SLNPREVNAIRSEVGCGSITTTDPGERPSASQASSIAPPILPAPTSTMVPAKSASVRAPCAVAVVMAVPRLIDREGGRPGISPALETTKRGRPRLLVPLKRGVDFGLVRLAGLACCTCQACWICQACLTCQAWPAVSNMAASSASRADLPAQITNWNAG